MKTTGIFSMLFLFTSMFNLSYGQSCCPFINQVQVQPAQPSNSTPVSIIVDVSTPAQGSVVYLNHNISGNNITIEGCYFSGMLPAIGTYIDTIHLGLLANGRYNVNFTARQTSSSTRCVANDSSTHGFFFNVGGPVQNYPCCINIDSTRIIPPQPRHDTDDIALVTWLQMPAGGHFMNDSIYSSGSNQWRVEACYYSDSNANAAYPRVDTFWLGSQTDGSYSLEFWALQSNDSNSCNVQDTTSAQLNFTVLPSDNTGLNDALNRQWSIYPNPATEQVWIEKGPLARARIVVYDSKGRVVHSHSGSQEGHRFSTEDWPRGLYWVQLGESSKKLLLH